MKNNFQEQRDMLIRQKEDYKKAIVNNVEETKTDLTSKAQMLLLGAGAILLGYAVVKVVEELVSDKKSPAPEQRAEAPVYAPPAAPPPSHEAEFSILRTIKEQIALFLIAVAKDKIMDFLDDLRKPRRQSASQSASDSEKE